MNKVKIAYLLSVLPFTAYSASAEPGAEAEISSVVFPENANIYNYRLPQLLPTALAPLAPEISGEHQLHFRYQIQSIKCSEGPTKPVLIFGTNENLLLLPQTFKPAPNGEFPVVRISLIRNIDRLNPSLIHLPSEVISQLEDHIGNGKNDLAGAYTLLNQTFDSHLRGEVLPPLGLPNFQEMNSYKVDVIANFIGDGEFAFDRNSMADRHLLGALTPYLSERFFEYLGDLEEDIIHREKDEHDLIQDLNAARLAARPAVYKEFLATAKRSLAIISGKKTSAEQIDEMISELGLFDFFYLGLEQHPIMKTLNKISEATKKAEASRQKNVKAHLEQIPPKEAATLLKKLDKGVYSNPRFPK